MYVSDSQMGPNKSLRFLDYVESIALHLELNSKTDVARLTSTP